MAEGKRSVASGRSFVNSDIGFREVLELSGDAVFCWDPEGRTLYASPAAVAQCGVPGSDSFDGLVDRLHPDDRQKLVDLWDGMKLNDGLLAVETRVLASSGVAAHFYWHFRSVRDEAGRLLRIHAVGRDITECHDAYQGLDSERRSESIIRLARGLSHDFNNMLVSVLGNASVLASQLEPNHPWRSIVEDIIAGADRAATLTRQLLTYARSTRHASHRIRLGDLLDDYMDRCRNAISPAIRLGFRHEAAEDVVDADTVQLGQVLLNLVLNAAEAMPNGGTVSVRTANLPRPGAGDSSEPGWVAMIVEDSGVGIAPEVRQRMFDPYYSTKGAGRGLGLAVVQGVVQSHKGFIEVESELEKGTLIRVFLPLNRSDA
jgi:two-component system, cell cycle sensor histidine kinase and response regulator CckA